VIPRTARTPLKPCATHTFSLSLSAPPPPFRSLSLSPFLCLILSLSPCLSLSHPLSLSSPYLPLSETAPPTLPLIPLPPSLWDYTTMQILSRCEQDLELLDGRILKFLRLLFALLLLGLVFSPCIQDLTDVATA